MSAKSRYGRKPSPHCPNNRARVATTGGAAVRVPGYGKVWAIDIEQAWAIFALSDPSDPNYDETLALGDLVRLDAERAVGEYGVTTEAYIGAVRELFRDGRIGIANGRTYFGEPVRNAAGELIGVRQFTEAEAVDYWSLADREWRDAHAAGGDAR